MLKQILFFASTFNDCLENHSISHEIWPLTKLYLQTPKPSTSMKFNQRFQALFAQNFSPQPPIFLPSKLSSYCYVLFENRKNMGNIKLQFIHFLILELKKWIFYLLLFHSFGKWVDLFSSLWLKMISMQRVGLWRKLKVE